MEIQQLLVPLAVLRQQVVQAHAKAVVIAAQPEFNI
jgi:hypothetical protein